MKHIPNILTTFRLFLIPVFAYFVIFAYNLWAAAIVFIIAGATDVADGFIARKCNAISDFGKFYDPLVDKLFQISAVVCLYIARILPNWIIFFIIFKEGSMIIIGMIFYFKKIVINSHWYGKAATVVFYLAILVMLLTQGMNDSLTIVLLCTVVASAILSAFGYFFDVIVKK